MTSRRRTLATIYRDNFYGGRRERLFLSSIGFLASFAVTRAVTHLLRMEHAGTSGGILVNGVHIHHLVFGIVILLVVGYLWMADIGTGIGASSAWGSRATCLLFGAGAALTLDEFALWLNIKDVYWATQGRESVDAVIVFGAILALGGLGLPFFRAVLHHYAPTRSSS